MNICVDFDDVLANFSAAFLAFSRTMYGSWLEEEQLTNPDFVAAWKIPREELMRRIVHFNTTRSKQDMLPLPGAQAMIARIAQKHSLHIVTNRPVEIAATTMEWVEQHFPGMFSDAHFCSRGKESRTFRSKSSVCKTIGASILLEDHPHNIISCAGDGIHIYLMDQPWNRQEFPLLPGAIIRVSSWQDEILETLL